MWLIPVALSRRLQNVSADTHSYPLKAIIKNQSETSLKLTSLTCGVRQCASIVLLIFILVECNPLDQNMEVITTGLLNLILTSTAWWIKIAIASPLRDRLASRFRVKVLVPVTGVLLQFLVVVSLGALIEAVPFLDLLRLETPHEMFDGCGLPLMISTRNSDSS
ncbi:hypothetical protein Tco_1319752 [Tanacetum coccineum]|uniref:PIN-like protein n=1 Tax=Tanacetum coccineum TaxID=301880 RepID=A0ABQ5GV93_9ASTR